MKVKEGRILYDTKTSVECAWKTFSFVYCKIILDQL